MIIGAYVKHAAPDHPAGAEWTMHDTLAMLHRRGHECQLLAEQGSTRQLIGGVSVWSQPSESETEAHFKRCDVMLTQLDATPAAQLLAVEHQTPLVHLMHSPNQLEGLGVLPGAAALVVFNTLAVAEACSWWWPGEWMIMRPPIDPERVCVGRAGAHVTLVNLSHEKGAARFMHVAQHLPARPFLGVMGAYGDQVITTAGVPGHGSNPLPAAVPANLRVMPPARDLPREVFPFTRVLLVLSRNETYGRIAGEAMFNGIPVVGTRTPGALECCASSMRYIEPHDGPATIAALVDATYAADWDEWQAESLAQARRIEQRTVMELDELERRLERIATAKPRMSMTPEPVS